MFPISLRCGCACPYPCTTALALCWQGCAWQCMASHWSSLPLATTAEPTWWPFRAKSMLLIAQMTFKHTTLCTIDCHSCFFSTRGAMSSMALPRCSQTCSANQIYTSMICHQLKRVRDVKTKTRFTCCVELVVMFRGVLVYVLLCF